MTLENEEYRLRASRRKLSAFQSRIRSKSCRLNPLCDPEGASRGSNTSFPVETVRAAFPALTRPPGFIFFDNAAGAQIPQIVLDAVNHHLLECNVQRGGRYAKSREVDATIVRARQSVADLVNARDPSEIAFGMNATSFIRLVSLAIGQTLGQAERDCRNRYGP